MWFYWIVNRLCCRSKISSTAFFRFGFGAFRSTLSRFFVLNGFALRYDSYHMNNKDLKNEFFKLLDSIVPRAGRNNSAYKANINKRIKFLMGIFSDIGRDFPLDSGIIELLLLLTKTNFQQMESKVWIGLSNFFWVLDTLHEKTWR